MNVADEVEEKLQRHDLLFLVSGRVCQLCRKLLNLVDDAIGSRTVRCYGARRDRRMIETSLVEVGRTDLDIDKMPLSRL